MKHKRVLLLVAIVVTFCLGITCRTITANATKQKSVKEIETSQYNSVKQNIKILSAFDSEALRKSTDSKEKTRLNYPDYYGGSYLNEDGELVVLVKPTATEEELHSLRDISENDELIYEAAEFSYSELCKMIHNAMEYVNSHKTEDYSNDICSCSLNDKDNRIEVTIYNLTDKKIAYFRDKISDSDAFYFVNAEKNTYSDKFSASTKNETNNEGSNILVKAGSPINSMGKKISMGFPAYRDITSGRQYGFVTCAHNLSDNNPIFYEVNEQPQGVIGTVQMRRLGGAYDVSFVNTNAGYTASRAIDKTLYSLIPSNDEIAYPVYGRTVYANTRHNTDTQGYINSTNFCGSVSHDSSGTNTTYYENLVKTTIPVTYGASGGLLSSQGPFIGDRVQEGIFVSSCENNQSLVCSAHNIVNLWYLTCY